MVEIDAGAFTRQLQPGRRSGSGIWPQHTALLHSLVPIMAPNIKWLPVRASGVQALLCAGLVQQTCTRRQSNGKQHIPSKLQGVPRLLAGGQWDVPSEHVKSLVRKYSSQVSWTLAPWVWEVGGMQGA